ncbi:MAG: cytochrome C biogenesis protein [Acidobacteria bacterium RIFCSPLOWO2_12_FULL_67_14b]|nr:MAG: cytochrome C biogenesis protein [Acidobacteria bacterium RIFCSPLOWO2_12_FULL_67_14b]
MENVSLLGAFVAGVLSFISPCVLPLIPGYLSFISGVSLEEMRGAGAVAGGGAVAGDLGMSAAAKRQVLITSLFFILGFSLVFVSLGASATFLGQFLMERLTLFGKIAGVLLIIFGLHTMGVFKIGFLLQEKRVQTNAKPAGMLGAMVVGISFAFGWTPCIGPILSAILLVAAQQDSVGQGILLLSVYSLGLAIPFLLTALAINQFFVAFKKIRRYYHAIEIVSGLLMIVIGVLIFTNRFTIIAQWLTPYLPTF